MISIDYLTLVDVSQGPEVYRDETFEKSITAYEKLQAISRYTLYT